MLPQRPSSPFGGALAQAPVQKVAEQKLTAAQLQERMATIKPMMDKLGLNGLQTSPTYQNYKRQYDDYGNQLRALTPNGAPTPAK